MSSQPIDIRSAARAVKRARHIRSMALARMDDAQGNAMHKAEKRAARAARLLRNAMREADQMDALADA